MNTTITLPERSSQFVAYTATSIDTPDENGQPQRFRSQAWVREFPSVLVSGAVTKEVSLPSGSTVKTTSFTFDAASTGIPNFRKDFTASLTEADPAHALLLQAKDRRLPVYVAIETVRKAKTKAGVEIPATMTIAELRGAQPDNSHGSSNATGDNCKNLIAAVAPTGHAEQLIVTSEATTIPAEWEHLRSNNAGTFAPAGWRTVPGGITNMAAAATVSPAGEMSEGQVEAIAQRVAQLIAPVDPQRGDFTRVRRNVASAEGKAWEPVNSDGTLNAGSDLMGRWRGLFDWSVRKLVSVGRGDDLIVDATQLTTLMLWMADQVAARQEAQRQRPRLYKSHYEASRFVELVIDQIAAAPTMKHLRFTPELLEADAKAQRADWAHAVIELATQLFVTAQVQSGAYIGHEGTLPQQVQREQQPQRQQRAVQSAPQQQSIAPNGRPDTAQQPQQQASEPVAQGVDPWDQPDPVAAATPAPAPAPAPVMADSLHDQWIALLDSTVQQGARFEDRFLPLVRATFGTADLAQIPAAAFGEQLARWVADRASFYAAAQQAVKAA